MFYTIMEATDPIFLSYEITFCIKGNYYDNCRCPAWCDRILLNNAAVPLVKVQIIIFNTTVVIYCMDDLSNQILIISIFITISSIIAYQHTHMTSWAKMFAWVIIRWHSIYFIK